MITASLGAAAIGATALPNPSESHWRSEILFDRGARSAFRADTEAARRGAATASDVVVMASIVSPALIEGVWGGAWPEWKSVQWAANAFFATQFMTQATKKVVGRERPAAAECRTTGVCDPLHDPNASFFSGHSSNAFTAAGLLCSRRFQEGAGFSPKGAPWFCAGGLALGASAGILRMVADKHYASDVVVGAGIGFASGYWLAPLLFPEEEGQEKPAAFVPMYLAGRGAGLRLIVDF